MISSPLLPKNGEESEKKNNEKIMSGHINLKLFCGGAGELPRCL